MLVALSLVSLRLCSFPGARRQREALEASVSGFDRERPLNIWEHATDKGSLVQPCAYLPPARHQVPLLFNHDSLQEQGTAESARSRYGWYTAVVTLEMLWLEKQVLLQWVDVPNLTPLFSSISSSGWRWQPETHWDFGCGNSLDTEAGVMKKLRAQSPEIPISVCRPVS